MQALNPESFKVEHPSSIRLTKTNNQMDNSPARSGLIAAICSTFEAMKIINRKEFMKMPAGTVFSKYQPCVFEGLEIKGRNSGEEDFVTTGELSSNVEASSSEEMFDRLQDAEETGASLDMDWERCGRDGCFESEQLFAVYEEKDVRELISLFEKSLSDFLSNN